MIAVANDNKPHPLLVEFYFWQSKVQPNKDKPNFLFKSPFKEWDQKISNFIWFYKFEYGYHEKSRQLLKEQLRIVK